MIDPADKDAVKEATDIVAVIGERVTLKKNGSRFVGLCPFHTEKTPSFGVNPALRVFHCFGCDIGGDVFSFLMQKDGMSFTDAVEFCAEKAGITLRYTGTGTARGAADGGRRRQLIAAHEKAAAFYHVNLMNDRGTARDYWKSRGFSGDDAERFGVGLAPSGWDNLVRHLSGEGFTPDLLVDAGLAVRSSTNRVIDRFRDRLMFPIHNQSGQAIAFGGRALPDGADPKYLNSAQTLLYDKGRVLYNLHRANASRGEIVIVEGYTDVIALHKADVPQAVATCGTALSETHLELLSNYSTAINPLRVVLAFDGDRAGRAAGERGFEQYGRFHLDMRVARIPDGLDPADFALGDPGGAMRSVADAAPLMQFKLEMVLSARPLADPESRARALRAAAASVAVHPDPIARDLWASWVATRLRVDKAMVDSEVRRFAKGNATSGPAPRPTGRAQALRGRPAREQELVRVAVHGPEPAAGQARAWPADQLTDPLALAVMAALVESGGSVSTALSTLEGPVAAYLGRVAVEPPDVDDRTVWAAEVMHLLEADRVRVEERAVRVEDDIDLERRIDLIRQRHALTPQSP